MPNCFQPIQSLRYFCQEKFTSPSAPHFTSYNKWCQNKKLHHFSSIHIPVLFSKRIWVKFLEKCVAFAFTSGRDRNLENVSSIFT